MCEEFKFGRLLQNKNPSIERFFIFGFAKAKIGDNICGRFQNFCQNLNDF